MNQESRIILPPERQIVTPQQVIAGPKPYEGFIKIWKSDPNTGESVLLVDKPNTILYSGSDLLAQALTGKPNTGISHMYIGYTNDTNTPAPGYTIAKNATTFSTTSPLGYLRAPLTFPATFKAEANYSNNIPVFTVLINNAGSFQVTTGSPATLTNGTSKFFEIALVAATDPAGTVNVHPGDKIFARAAFDKVTYDSAFNLTISWGIRFIS